MKKILTFLLLVVLYTTVKAQSNDAPYLTKSLSGAAIQKVTARTSGGSISVNGVADGEPHVEVYVRSSRNANYTKEQIQEKLAENYTLDISVANGQLAITAAQKNKIFERNELSISFKIYVPRNIATDIHTSGGSISIADLTGDQSFSTSGGSININRLSGNIDGRTSGGSINVADSKNQITLRTSGGSIKAQNCSGTISLSTSGGSLSLNNLDGTIEAKTSGGSVHGNNITGELTTRTSGGSMNLQDISASLNASNHGGSINVGIAKVGKYLTLDNSGGSINLKMPNQALNLDLHAQRISVNPLTNFNGNKDKDSINGTINGGGVLVKARSSGSMSITFN